MTNKESKLLEKRPCPNCKAKGYDWDGNGLALYDDGHTYCFKCKLYTLPKPNTIFKITEGTMTIEKDIGHIHMNKMLTGKDLFPSEFIGKYEAIEDRGIDIDTCRKLDITTGQNRGNNAICFTYDKGVKIREEGKKFYWIEGIPRECSMFGLDKAGDYTKPITITEGEIDTASLVKISYQACSLHSGADSVLQCLEHDKKELLKYSEIWLAFDNDEAGKRATELALTVLPLEKVKIVNFGEFKDANEALLGANLGHIMLHNVTEWRPEGIIFGDEVDWEQVWEPRPEGLRLPWTGLQDMIKGLHKGRLYLFGGGASIGKSSVLRELSYFLRMEYPDLKIAHLFLEEDIEAGPLTYLSIHKDIPLGDLLENKSLIPIEDRKELQKILNKNTMFTNEQYELGSEELLRQLEWLAKIKKYDIIVLDHISMVAEASDSKESERIQINKLMLKLRSLVRRTGLIVLAACHLSNPDQGKDWEEGREVRQKDFHGSSALRKVPDVMIGVERNMRDKYNCDQLHINNIIILGYLKEIYLFMLVISLGKEKKWRC